MKVLQISSDYLYTKVYYKLFNILSEHMSLCTIVPVQNNFQTIATADTLKINYVKQGRPRIFGVQINSIKTAKYIQKNNLLENVDLIHSHYILNDGVIALHIYKLTGIPYVVSVRASCIMNFARKIALHNYISGLQVLLNAKSIYFQSLSSLNNLINELPYQYKQIVLKKHLIIPNGIDDFWHENIYKKDNFNLSNKFVIITVASIERNKNLLNVAKVVELMNKNGYDITYKVAGKIIDDNIYNELQNYRCFNYLGVLDMNELMNQYRASDIFIMLSYSETFGLVYAEALSQGLPIIYTENQGFDGQFPEGFLGYHCNATSLIEIENSIIRVINNYKNLSLNTFDSISKFKWDSIADNYRVNYLKHIISNV
jgi:glycosyltransferase involved in cell wall biosynthesis